MRFIHFSDLHIGVENYGRVDPVTGFNTRLIDFLNAFDELVDFAIHEQIDAVIFAGDAYKSRDPSQTHQREFARRLARLSAAGIPVFLCVGNHDLPNAISRATALDIFSVLQVAQVQVADRFGSFRLPTRSGPLQIIGVPWATRSRMMGYDDLRNLSLAELNEHLVQTLVDNIALKCDELDPAIPAVLVGHLTHSGAVIGSERTMMIGSDPVIMKSNITGPGIDYVALGHIHKKQELDGPTPVAYAGSMQRVDFGEEADPKGFFVVELDPSRPRGERVTERYFHEVKARQFVTVEVTPKLENPTEEVLRAIERKTIADAVVRVQVHLSRAQMALLDDRGVREALRSAYTIAAIAKDVIGDARPRLGELSVTEMTPLKILERYLEVARGSLKSDPQLVLEYGRRLLSEAEHHE